MHHPNPEELKKLLGVIDRQAPFGERDFAWIILALHTGLRVGELVSLNVGQVVNVDGQPRKAFVVPGTTAKYNENRLIPLNETARKAVATLVAFNRKRGFSVDPTAPLLVNRKHQRISARAARYALEKYCKRADLDVSISPHSLRHGFACALIGKSSTRVTQAALGHVKLTSTAKYTHVMPGELQAGLSSLGRRG